MIQNVQKLGISVQLPVTELLVFFLQENFFILNFMKKDHSL